MHPGSARDIAWKNRKMAEEIAKGVLAKARWSESELVSAGKPYV